MSRFVSWQVYQSLVDFINQEKEDLLRNKKDPIKKGGDKTMKKGTEIAHLYWSQVCETNEYGEAEEDHN